MREEVILVNEMDEAIGTGEKHETHLHGRMHRAFSIFVFNSRGDLLLQRRAPNKYHSAGLWSNTCCGHPRPHETVEQAAHRRLREEMGFDCELHPVFAFVYRTELDNQMIEHEYDHVLVGSFDGTPAPDNGEVSEWRWVNAQQLVREISRHPERYTYWLRALSDRLKEWQDRALDGKASPKRRA
ncbi:MAG: isopentenyl-diphosphate delta-isomerase [Pyrinomonas sp.]|uniref:isopentenyl-diphosphate Delta-isomerase n=1 Tax=Pyrinomonas sp. TaxID=2080306 RepID=UPI00331DC6AF